MSLRFRRSMKILPGVRLNFSKSALGLSFGVPGARVSVNTRGDVYTSAGIPGTGLYNVERTSLRKGSGRKRRAKNTAAETLTEFVPPPGLFAPRRQRALYKALQLGTVEALEKLSKKFPDIEYICDAFALPRHLMSGSNDLELLTAKAAKVWATRVELDRSWMFTHHAKAYEVSVKVAPGVDVPMQFSLQVLGHMYIELLQLGEKFIDALEVAESLIPDQITALAVCENEVQLRRWKDVLETTEDVTNEDDATALLLIFRAIALREEGKLDASIETLRLARASKKRHEDILNKALFERSFVYEKQGKISSARKDLEKILATDSDFPGVTQRLKDLENL